MEKNRILITNAEKLESEHQNDNGKYEYYRKPVLSGESGDKCNVSIYEIPPGKSAWPYHYHYQSEEVFYIISGKGILRTPDGEVEITAGDILAFPPGEKGAHKITNTSDNEKLVYIDFDTYHAVDLSFMPDSDKTLIYGKGLRKIVKNGTDAGFYDGE